MSVYFEARDLVVRYERVIAVRGVSITLRQGEVVALVGANGAGKTSILRAATGLSRPASGEIWFDGHRIDGQNIDRIVARGVAMVPEGRRIFPYMNVRDNLLLGAHRRRGTSEIRADLDRIYLRFPVLRERQRQQGGSLSGGEQQMVSMGRAPHGATEIAASRRTVARIGAHDGARDRACDHGDQYRRWGQRHSRRAELANGPEDLPPGLCP